MTRRADTDTLATLRAMLVAEARPTVRTNSAPHGLAAVVADENVERKARAKAKRERKSLSAEIEVKARRSPGNVAEHVRVPYLGPDPKTSASAAKLRREAMLMCPCRLCALALYPAQTFAEYADLQLHEPSFAEAEEGRLFDLRAYHAEVTS